MMLFIAETTENFEHCRGQKKKTQNFRLVGEKGTSKDY